jgi:hypothetical protein
MNGTSKNYGIIGSVNAKNVAIGDNATASSADTITSIEQADIEPFLIALVDCVEQLNLNTAQSELLKSDIADYQEKIRDAGPSADDAQSFLQGFYDKLKMTGTVLEEGQKIVAPLLGIAKLFGVAVAGLL